MAAKHFNSLYNVMHSYKIWDANLARSEGLRLHDKNILGNWLQEHDAIS